MTHNRGLKIAGDFKQTNDKIIPRQKIRAFIYYCIAVQGIIENTSKNCINIVMDRYNLKIEARNKVKKMIEVILKRDNDNLPPIIYQNPIEFKRKSQTSLKLMIDYRRHHAITEK